MPLSDLNRYNSPGTCPPPVPPHLFDCDRLSRSIRLISPSMLFFLSWYAIVSFDVSVNYLYNLSIFSSSYSNSLSIRM